MPLPPLSRRTALRAAAVAGAAVAAACARQAGSSSLASPSAGGRGAALATSGGSGLRVDPSPDPAASAESSPGSAASGAPAAAVSRGPRDRPSVALTFHGSGEPAQAVALLDAVERAGAHVTVLAVGNWLAANPQLARRILDAGHDLGNHTETHPALGRLGRSAVEREVAGCRDTLLRLTGSPGSWFRPSGMAEPSPLVLDVAGRLGYRTVLGYDVDPRDYQDPGATVVRDRVLAAVAPGSVVSLHLGHPGTVQAMPAILAGLAARGLTATTASDLLR